MKEAEMIMQKYVTYKDIKIVVSIYKTTYFYDIIISSDKKSLQEIKDINCIDSDILNENIVGKTPMIVYDTTEDYKDALSIYNKIEEELE